MSKRSSDARIGNGKPYPWRRYPAYKPSGVEWLGEMPEGWKVRKLKYISTIRLGTVDKKTEEGEMPVRLCNYVDVYYNDYIVPDLAFMEATASSDEIKNFTLRKGDVLITKDSEEWMDIAVSAYVKSDLPGVLCGYHLAHIRPDKRSMDGEYLFRSFQACGINDQFRVAANGITRFGIGKFWIDSSVFLVPPKPEQISIATFLDRETARIDALIEKKERQIELLKEKRAALISHAVTKGLDPSVKMKETGVEWLGRVPEPWKVIRLAMAVKKITNGFVGPTRDIFVDGGVRYLQSLHIKNGEIHFNKPYFVTSEWSNQHTKSILKEGDVLIVQTGDIGQCCTVPKEFENCNCHALIIIQLKDGLGSGYYLSAFLRSYYGQNLLKSIQTGALHPHLETGKVREINILLPPVKEQDKIMEYIRKESEEIDNIVGKISDSINRLHEYHSTLISAAVTGKIDVRQEAKV
jgi:type I restriction enzyme, S subunit